MRLFENEFDLHCLIIGGFAASKKVLVGKLADALKITERRAKGLLYGEVKGPTDDEKQRAREEALIRAAERLDEFYEYARQIENFQNAASGSRQIEGNPPGAGKLDRPQKG